MKSCSVCGRGDDLMGRTPEGRAYYRVEEVICPGCFNWANRIEKTVNTH